MPHKQSLASRLLRIHRALTLGYVRPLSPGVAHVEVPSAMVDQVKKVTKRMQLHARHDSPTGVPHYHPRLATLEAKESLQEKEFKHAQSVHKAAGLAKHIVGVEAVAALSGPSVAATHQSRSSRSWVDIDDDDDDDDVPLLSAHGGAPSPILECARYECEVGMSSKGAMNKEAAEFVPAPPCDSFCVPSIGAQLDFMLQDALSKCDAVKGENARLESRIAELEVSPKVNSESGSNTKHDGGATLSIEAVVAGGCRPASLHGWPCGVADVVCIFAGCFEGEHPSLCGGGSEESCAWQQDSPRSTC